MEEIALAYLHMIAARKAGDRLGPIRRIARRVQLGKYRRINKKLTVSAIRFLITAVRIIENTAAYGTGEQNQDSRCQKRNQNAFQQFPVHRLFNSPDLIFITFSHEFLKSRAAVIDLRQGVFFQKLEFLKLLLYEFYLFQRGGSFFVSLKHFLKCHTFPPSDLFLTACVPGKALSLPHLAFDRSELLFL